jgi:hypothetical protein
VAAGQDQTETDDRKNHKEPHGGSLRVEGTSKNNKRTSWQGDLTGAIGSRKGQSMFRTLAFGDRKIVNHKIGLDEIKAEYKN